MKITLLIVIHGGHLIRLIFKVRRVLENVVLLGFDSCCFSLFDITSVCRLRKSAIIIIDIFAENLVVSCIRVLPALAHIIWNLSQSSVIIGKEKPVTIVMGSNGKTTSCRITRGFAFRPHSLTSHIFVVIT